MAFWNRNRNWEDEYDQYYAQDRRAEPRTPSKRAPIFRHLLLLIFVGLLFVGGVGIVSGPTMAEQLLTSLATPLGIAWLGLILQVYFCLLFRQAWPAIVGFFCWIVLTIGGNQFVSNGLARSLEAPFQNIEVADLEAFNTLVILGGGTDTNVAGRAELGISGDRIAVAARIYHAGKAKRIVCTGTQNFRSAAKDLHPREEATEILIGMGVPPAVIFQIKGENTSQEMANLKKWVEEQESRQPIGLVTSAWHLKRAIRISNQQDLKLVPVPSNFVSMPFAPSPSLIVPSSENLMVTEIMIKEYLARIVGR